MRRGGRTRCRARVDSVTLWTTSSTRPSRSASRRRSTRRSSSPTTTRSGRTGSRARRSGSARRSATRCCSSTTSARPRCRGLPAKPLIDINLVVADTTDEDAYVPPLEAIGYVLRVREPDWFEHRMLRGHDPPVNLHVFNPGCEELDQMLAAPRLAAHARRRPRAVRAHEARARGEGVEVRPELRRREERRDPGDPRARDARDREPRHRPARRRRRRVRSTTTPASSVSRAMPGRSTRTTTAT